MRVVSVLNKLKMYSFRLFLNLTFLLFSNNFLLAQENSNIIRQDSIFVNNELVGLVGKFSTGIFIDKNSMKRFRIDRDKFDLKWYKVDEYVLREKLIIDRRSNSIFNPDSSLLAELRSANEKGLIITLYSVDADKEFIKYTLQKSGFLPDVQLRFEIPDEIQEEYFRNKRIEQDSIAAAQARIRAEQSRIKAEAEKNRIERFYATLTERLSQELDPIEGVYKSIDQGESFEYDIAILKSLSNEREYISLVLESTDPSFTVGSGVFTFTKTAGPSVYFVSYQNKAGQQFENKTATFDGVLLSMGVKSFVKMYPSENESRKYNEINPLFDWESSGSGALINKDGYIVTNNHVVTGADKIRIAFQNDSIDYNAVIISQNEAADVAVLQIVDNRFKSEITPVSWSTDFNLGQKVFTLGYPISNKMSNNVKVVDGIVSGETGVGGNSMYFQTTLPVWYGNSGGPCFNSKGEIVGLATQILWDRGEKVDNVAYITKTENIFNLGKEIIIKGESDGEEKNLEQLIEQLIPYSVFIKVNY